MSSISLINRLQNTDQIVLVPMNECKITYIGQKLSVGTRDLNSCTGVIILSPLAIILAHIAPRPDGTTTANDRGAGDRHVMSKMNEVAEIYRDHRQWFPAEFTACGVFAQYLSEIALPDQEVIVMNTLTSLGIYPENYSYNVPTNDNKPSAGTIVAGWLRRKTCELFIEDDLKTTLAVPKEYVGYIQTMRSATVAGSIAPTTSTLLVRQVINVPSSARLTAAASSLKTPTNTPKETQAVIRSIARAAIVVLTKVSLRQEEVTT